MVFLICFLVVRVLLNKQVAIITLLWDVRALRAVLGQLYSCCDTKSANVFLDYYFIRDF